MAKSQDCEFDRGFHTSYTSRYGNNDEITEDADLVAFRQLLRPHLQRLENQGRLGSCIETLDIISAILEHHMTKAAEENKKRQ